MSETSGAVQPQKLVITSEHPPLGVVEFITLCAQGRLKSDGRLDAWDRRLLFQIDRAGTAIEVFAADDTIDWGPKGSLLELTRVYLGLRLLQAKIEVVGPWSSHIPDETFVAANITQDMLICDVKESLVSELLLSLADLDEIGARLFGQTRPATELVDDARFCEAFPAIESKWGTYGFARHRSGTEIRTVWDDETHCLKSHGVEAPSPSEDLARRWLTAKGVKREIDEYLKFREKKWRLAKLLHRVPQRHKQRVYEWVITTHFDVEEFHSTHGGYWIPESFECEFDKSIIFCGRDLEFDMIEC